MQQGKMMQNKSMKRESKLKANLMIYGRIIRFSNRLQSGYNRHDNDNVIFYGLLRFILNRFFLIFFDKKRVQTLYLTIRKTQLLRKDSGEKDDERGVFDIICDLMRILPIIIIMNLSQKTLCFNQLNS